MLYKDVEIKQVLKNLETGENSGLSEAEAKKRLEKYGRNKIAEKKRFSALKIFIRQFYDFLTLILIISTVLALFVGKIPTAIAIGIIVVINVILGFVMEYKSEKSLRALKQMLKAKARVIRDGREQMVDSILIVPGDILIIEEGQQIPADARIIEENNLRVNQAALTGESVPVQKYVEDPKNKDSNIVFLGTTAVAGYGKAIVIATGKETEFGQIAQSLSEIKEPFTPLQKQVVKLGKLIVFVGFILAGLILFLGVLQGKPFLDYQQLMMALSIFVSVVPAGLLVVMTLTLAIGVRRMARQKAIIKRLSSVETLGSTQIICTDKTGTLTDNKMTAKKIWVGGKFFEVGEIFDISQSKDLEILIKAGVICNSAWVNKNQKGGWDILGDPTEASLLVLGEKAGYNKKETRDRGNLLKEFAFEQKVRRRAAVFQEFKNSFHRFADTCEFQENNEISFYSIGSPENVLEISRFYLKDGQEIELSKNYREIIEQTFRSLAKQGYRIIALATRALARGKDEDLSSSPSKIIQKQGEYEREELEKEMVFLGLVALYDPPRQGVKEAIQECRNAGIKTVMITGDNELTALAIAEEVDLGEETSSLLPRKPSPSEAQRSKRALALGARFADARVIQREKKVMLGKDIEKMSDNELSKALAHYNIFARVMPHHKLRIVEALQKKGKVVAVTGDGVNDATAIKEADIGIAMGIRGTDVSKEASDMIIIDDNFISIGKAVKEGRVIYDNIKKFIQFLLTANAIEAPLIIIAIIFGMPMPLMPLHILWINFITDSVPAMTLGIEPGAKDIMKRKPRPSKEHILKGTGSFIIFASFLGFIISLILFQKIYDPDLGNLIYAQTVVFTFIVIYKLFLVFSAKSNAETIFELGIFSNKKMVLAVIFSFILQVMVIYWVFLQGIFSTVSLPAFNWFYIFALAIISFLLVEFKKIILRKRC